MLNKSFLHISFLIHLDLESSGRSNSLFLTATHQATHHVFLSGPPCSRSSSRVPQCAPFLTLLGQVRGKDSEKTVSDISGWVLPTLLWWPAALSPQPPAPRGRNADYVIVKSFVYCEVLCIPWSDLHTGLEG